MDGFPSEFYKFFWTDIKQYLLQALNYNFRQGELSISQREGLITFSAAAKSPFFSATQTGLTSFSNHIFLVALGLPYMRNAVDIAESDGELRN